MTQRILSGNPGTGTESHSKPDTERAGGGISTTHTCREGQLWKSLKALQVIEQRYSLLLEQGLHQPKVVSLWGQGQGQEGKGVFNGRGE